MSKLTKTLLVLGVTGLVLGFIFVSGFVNVERFNALYVVLPFGAIFFGLFLVSRMLEKEVVLHDQEQQRLLLDAIDAEANASRPRVTRGGQVGHSSELVGAKAG